MEKLASKPSLINYKKWTERNCVGRQTWSLQSALVRILRRRGLEAHSMNLWAVNPTPSQRKTMSGWIWWSTGHLPGHLLNSAQLAFDDHRLVLKRCVLRILVITVFALFLMPVTWHFCGYAICNNTPDGVLVSLQFKKQCMRQAWVPLKASAT